MPDDFGLSFAPFGRDNENQPPSPVQDAVRVLSLRLPTVVGAQGIAPGPLLNSPGLAGLMTGDMTPEAFLRRLFGMSSAGPQGPVAPTVPSGSGPSRTTAGSVPLPRVVPIAPPGLPPGSGVGGPGGVQTNNGQFIPFKPMMGGQPRVNLPDRGPFMPGTGFNQEG